MQDWPFLIHLVVLLTAALVFGTIAERLRQSAIVGYLLAGAVVGPGVLGLFRATEQVHLVADLGVALLLFTIGLEFSLRRLRRLGTIALAGGGLQIALTCAAVWAIGWLGGTGGRAAFALGAMIAMSSTATVMRLLGDRAELETPYGRSAVGILLLQDTAVLPLTLLTAALAHGGNALGVLGSLLRTLLFAGVMVLAFVVLFNYIVPRLLNMRQWAANREFPILLAAVMAIGSAAAAQQLGISPAMGAFLAGVLLAESQFAVQIRADVVSFRIVFVTLFFASIGMLFDPAWVAHHGMQVAVVAATIILGKTLLVGVLLRPLGLPLGMSFAAGLCIAQVGEFSFVLAQIARGSLLSDPTMNLMISVTVITLMLTPYLVKFAPQAAGWLEHWRHRRPVVPSGEEPKGSDEARPIILIIGFGPAGQRIAEHLIANYRERLVVIDLNPRATAVAQRYGLALHMGNAGQPEVLEHAGVHRAAAVVVTLPDPGATRQVIDLCRHLNPAAGVFVRARYHAFRWELELAGADVVIDEEETLGRRLASEVRRALRKSED